MPFPFAPDPDALTDRAHEAARWHPERETLELAAAGAAQVLGPDHGVTKALARASLTMAKADLWLARIAIKTLRLEQREAIAEAGLFFLSPCGTMYPCAPSPSPYACSPPRPWPTCPASPR